MHKSDHPCEAFPLIHGCAELTPAAVALLAPGKEPLTFGELLHGIETTEKALGRYGIGPDEVVALALPDGPEMAVAVVGVGRTRACAPLNPSLTATELESCLYSLRPGALIAPCGIDSAATAAARAAGVPILDVVAEPDAPAGSFTLDLRCGASPAQRRNAAGAAILLFTSATTGRPKLVPLSHGNLNAICRNTSVALQLRAGDRFLSLMPLFHLQGLACMLAQWGSGGSVVCPAGFDPVRLLSWFGDFQPTWYTAGPTLHHTILTLLGDNSPPCRLRFVRSIGAPMTPELLLAVEKAVEAPLLEGYGLTECGLVTSSPLPPRGRKPGSVGIPLETEVRILDPSGRPLAPGFDGEIVLRGPAVTSGYLDPADANLAAFREGWLRTGDVGRFDAEGYLTVTGRLKEIINRGGEKIMPQEVDRALAAHAGVAEAAAFAVSHATLGEDVMAAVVLSAGAGVSGSELRDFAAARIARFKVPRRIFFVDHIPKGATGKPNRVALTGKFRAAARAPDAGTEDPAGHSGNGDPAASGDVTHRLAAIWAEVLGIPQAGPDDNFFEMGGHSLMAAHLFSRIEQEMGKKLPLNTLFHAPTVASLARLLREPGGAAGLSRIIPIQPKGPLRPFFMVRPMPIYRPLARLLSQDRPFLGVTLPDGRQFSGEDRMKDIAEDLVRLIRIRQPVGPYHLGGWCADGVLAYEMARQIESQGGQVALVVLFDSPNPAYMKALSRRQLTIRRLRLLVWNAKYQLASLRQLDRHEITGYVGQRLKALVELAGTSLPSGRRNPRPEAHGGGNQAWRPSGMRVWIRGYRPEALKGQAILFRSAGWGVRNSEDASFGWAAVAGDRLTVYQVPGDHHSIFLEPNVRILAENLAIHLKQ